MSILHDEELCCLVWLLSHKRPVEVLVTAAKLSLAHHPVKECEVRVQDRVVMCLCFGHDKHWARLKTCL